MEEPSQPSRDVMAAIHFRAEDLARRTVEFHRLREAEHRARERFGRRFRPFPWSEAVAAVLSDEALEDEGCVVELIRELGRQGCSEVAMAALDLVLTRGSPVPTKPMFDAAIRVCATEYQDQRCLDALFRMRSLGLSPDLGTTNLVLAGLCCRGRLEAAMGLAGEMRAQMGIRPNSFTALMILQACNCKQRGAYREAIEAVQALEAGGVAANEEVVEALMQVCEAAMRRAPTFEGALAVFSALSGLQLADCTRVYNGLLGAAGRTGRWREAQELYARMRVDGIPPSLETHTALIQACVVGRALDHALHLFEQLVAGRAAHEAVPASIATYNHLIHACHQAGMLEKALEIASWVQRTGVAFDDDTYGELMATIDVAQLWDDKAMKQARQQHRVVVPRSLRPAPYDAMRVMYLDHLEALQQEELLALEKLGGRGCWAAKSLTCGSTPGSGSGATALPSVPSGLTVSDSVRPSLRPSVTAAAGSPTQPLSAGGPPYRGPTGVQQQGGPQGGGGGGGDGGRAVDRNTSSRSVSPSQVWEPHGPHPRGRVSGTGAAATAATSSYRSHSWGGPVKPQHQQHPQPQQQHGGPRNLSSLRPPPLQGVGAGGGLSFRAAGSPSPSPSPSPLAAPLVPPAGPPSAPTGYHEPPSWAQVQTLDAATAGPSGTPFSAAVAAAVAAAHAAAGDGGSDGPHVDAAVAMALTLAIEPSNILYGQPSSASLNGVGTSRTSLRSIPPPGMGGAGAGTAISGGNGVLPVVLSPAAAAPVSGTLPPLGEAALLPSAPAPALLFGSQAQPPKSPKAAAATAAAAAAPVAPATGPARQRPRAASGLVPPHPGGGGAAEWGPGPAPLPALSAVGPLSSGLSVPAGATSRRYPLPAWGK